MQWLALAAVPAAAAVLMGWLWDAREASRARPALEACQRNLLQIGQAVRMYAADYDDRLPSCAAGRDDVAGLLEPYRLRRDGPDIWRCPGQVPFSGGRWTSSYGYNWQYLLEPGPDYPHTDWEGFSNAGIKLTAITRPERTLMFVDQKPVLEKPYAELWTYVVRPGQSLKEPDNLSGMGVVDFRHHRQTNVLFCDGRVAALGGEIKDERKYWDPR
jgi:prepilin-type processing-associated H-X9-DG protein